MYTYVFKNVIFSFFNYEGFGKCMNKTCGVQYLQKREEPLLEKIRTENSVIFYSDRSTTMG